MGGGGGGGEAGLQLPPNNLGFSPYKLLTFKEKVPIYCVPLQYKFSDYLLGLNHNTKS